MPKEEKRMSTKRESVTPHETIATVKIFTHKRKGQKRLSRK